MAEPLPEDDDLVCLPGPGACPKCIDELGEDLPDDTKRCPKCGHEWRE